MESTMRSLLIERGEGSHHIYGEGGRGGGAQGWLTRAGRSRREAHALGREASSFCIASVASTSAESPTALTTRNRSPSRAFLSSLLMRGAILPAHSTRESPRLREGGRRGRGGRGGEEREGIAGVEGARARGGITRPSADRAAPLGSSRTCR